MTTVVIVYWDIDGTLLTTGRQGIAAWEGALEEVLGRRLDLSGYDSAGKTDKAIARELIAMIDTAHDHGVEQAVVASYVRELPRVIDPSIGGALPNVLNTLLHLDTITTSTSSLITGNMSSAAEAKLKAYGLHGFFTHGGFGEDGYDRASIGRAARARMRSQPGAAIVGEVLVGDTPHDVACGTALGIPTIAVATGAYGIAELRDAGSSLVLSGLPDPEEFADLVMGLTPR
jgi:phosphoglycolate phosphatase